jgi:hypothetical protein
MDRKRLEGILEEADSAGSAASGFERLCAASIDLLAVSGMSAMVMSAGLHHGILFSSDRRATAMEDLQFSIGEGPCLESYGRRHPVLVDDVAAHDDWPAFRSSAAEAGLAAIFAFPLQAFSAPVGVFDFYRDEPGSLPPEEVEGAMVLADAGTRLVLAVMAERPPGWLPRPLERMMEERRRVHQASGMAAVLADVDVDDALACLRAHAWAEGRSLAQVSSDLLEGRLRLDA